jgi:hypothetical protein
MGMREAAHHPRRSEYAPAVRDALELLWLDPRIPARLRRKPEWQRLLDEGRARRNAADPVPVLPNQKASAEDRADVMEILTLGQESDGAAVRAAVAAGTRADGRFAPPLLLVGGDLSLSFDELEMLKGLAANALPFAVEDESLQTAVDAAAEYLRLPGLLATPLAVEALARRIREAFARTPRGVPADFLDAHTQRALLDHRQYQTRIFHGAPHLRILIGVPGESSPTLLFASPKLAMSLPLSPRFPARLVVEAHLFSDQYEPQPFALELLAVARRVGAPSAEAAAMSGGKGAAP